MPRCHPPCPAPSHARRPPPGRHHLLPMPPGRSASGLALGAHGRPGRAAPLAPVPTPPARQSGGRHGARAPARTKARAPSRRFTKRPRPSAGPRRLRPGPLTLGPGPPRGRRARHAGCTKRPLLREGSEGSPRAGFHPGCSGAEGAPDSGTRYRQPGRSRPRGRAPVSGETSHDRPAASSRRALDIRSYVHLGRGSPLRRAQKRGPASAAPERDRHSACRVLTAGRRPRAGPTPPTSAIPALVRFASCPPDTRVPAPHVPPPS
jgi:hypothetical protein